MSRRAGRSARPGLFSFARRSVVPQTQTTTSADSKAAALADTVAPVIEALEGRRLLSAPTFMIGAWGQPTTLFQRWKDRGINTMFHKPEPDTNHPIDTWTQEAVNKGLYMVRKPRPVLADDVNQANLIGWLQPDEPDRHELETFDVLQDRYDTWKAADPNRKVYMTFSGGTVLDRQDPFHDDPATGQPYTPQAYYPQASQYADVVGQDFYPVTGWDQPNWINFGVSGEHYTPGMAVDALRGYSGGKPQYAIIETSDQNLSHVPNARGVNAAEYRGQLWDAIIHGATGIIYFSYHWSGGNFAGFDATPTDVHNEMIAQHARINALDDVLVSPRNPSALSFSPSSPTTTKPLQATWRQDANFDYFIVENMSSNPLTDVSFTLGRSTPFTTADFSTSWQTPDTAGSGGAVTDDFQPYETLIYAIRRDNTGHDAYENIQAEDFNSTNGAVNYGTHIGDITNDDFVRYDNVDFGTGGAASFVANLAVDAGHAGGRVEVWLDHRSLGTKIADLTIQSTGSYANFQNQSVGLTNAAAATGVHNVFLLFKGTNNTLANVDWFKFARTTVIPVTIEAETYNSTNGAVNYGTHIGDLTNDDFVRYDNVNFGAGGFTTFLANLAVDAGHAGGRIEVWLDDRTTGTKIADLTIQSTGGYSNFQTQTVALLNAAAVTGVHNVFLKFKGTNNTLANVDWFRFA